MRFVYLICFVFVLFMSGCDQANPQNQSPVYYDVLAFVKAQIADLSARKPLVNKLVSINDKQSHQQTNEINWNHELELFTQADINKPALRSSYDIARPDSLTYRYTLKKSEEQLSVRSLVVQLDSLTQQPRRIEVVLRTNNALYASERHLLLESGPDRGSQFRVQHYKLSGFQKLSYFDKNTFLVEGRVQ